VNSDVLGYRQPTLPAKSVDAATTALLRYRIMAFVTGVVLLSGCVTLILKYGTSLDMEPLTGYVWVAHGWLYLIYVVMTAILGFKLRWPLARYALVMLAGTIPTASFVAEHFVTRQTRGAAQPEPVRD
jgi:integral membrane protein